MKYNYIIGCGWWADGTGIHEGSKPTTSPETRKVDFFNLWYKSINKYTNPEKIIIVDSNSPKKPNYKKFNDNRIEWVSLNKNFGHGISANFKNPSILPGWDRSVILSAAYADFCDVDYYCYIEQDALLKGNNIIEYAIDHLEKINRKNPKIKMLLGHPKGTPQKLQQSFILCKKEFIPRLYNQARIPENNSSEQKYFNRFKGEFAWLPFQGGRTRPINWNDKYFYAQHMTEKELNIFKKILR